MGVPPTSSSILESGIFYHHPFLGYPPMAMETPMYWTWWFSLGYFPFSINHPASLGVTPTTMAPCSASQVQSVQSAGAWRADRALKKPFDLVKPAKGLRNIGGVSKIQFLIHPVFFFKIRHVSEMVYDIWWQKKHVHEIHDEMVIFQDSLVWKIDTLHLSLR